MAREPVTLNITPAGEKTLEIMKRADKKVVAKPLQALVRTATLYAERRAKSNAPYDTGEALRSIQSEIKPDQGIVYTTSFHAALMEGDDETGFARAPQKQERRARADGSTYLHQTGLPPLDVIEAWAKRRGILGKQVTSRRTGLQYKITAYILARAIARKGIRGRFYFRQAMIDTNARMPQFLRQFEQDLQKSWSEGQQNV